MIIASQFIHNARNRLMGLVDYLESSGQKKQSDEILRIGSLLSTAMALLKLENKHGESLSVQEVELEYFFTDLRTQVSTLSPANITTTCEADFSKCIFPIWTFDDELVRMVIIDALMNAWRYTAQEVHLRAYWENSELIFSVEDDGPGYPPSILENQGMESVTSGGNAGTQESGTGNGIFLARRIAEKHRMNGKSGQIRLSNRQAPEHGAIFELHLP